jgi:Flp pilus assembly protein TadG
MEDRERGAALVEMAVVVGLLALFLFGIITYGLVMSFDQSLTQAANEAGRAGAVAPRDVAVERARAAANRVASGWGTECGGGEGLTCSFVIAPCSNGGSSVTDCMTVELRYDLDAHPRTPTLPVISQTLPDELVATVVVEVNPDEATP